MKGRTMGRGEDCRLLIVDFGFLRVKRWSPKGVPEAPAERMEESDPAERNTNQLAKPRT